jgi:hypothetical protein
VYQLQQRDTAAKIQSSHWFRRLSVGGDSCVVFSSGCVLMETLLLHSIRKSCYSNINRGTSYLGLVFRCFSQSLQVNADLIHLSRS